MIIEVKHLMQDLPNIYAATVGGVDGVPPGQPLRRGCDGHLVGRDVCLGDRSDVDPDAGGAQALPHTTRPRSTTARGCASTPTSSRGSSG